MAFEIAGTRRGRRAVGLLEVGTARSLDDARVIEVPGGATFPVFRRDGSLVVAAQRRDRDGQPQGPARGLVLDPATGAARATFDYGGTVTSQDYDASGTYLLYTLADGTVAWRGAGEDGTISVDGQVRDAVW